MKAQNRPLKGKKLKSFLLFFNMCILFAPRDTPDLSTKDKRKQSITYLRRTTEYSNRRYLTHTHRDVLLNTKKRDLHPYASPEGARHTPLKGNKWRLLNGTLGAAMRLKTLSQAHPKTTRHPKISRQTRNYQNPEKNIPCLHNHPHTCCSDATFPST